MSLAPDLQGVEAGGRSARKHQAILDAATAVFLQKGYLGASMDEIAALAAVSKQTVYKQFTDKEALFNAIVLGTTVQVATGIADAAEEPPHHGDRVDTVAEVQAMATGLVASIMRPEVLQIRRLIIAEADRFPELARTWYELGFLPALASIAARLKAIADTGGLQLRDPTAAANHLAGLVLWIPVNRAMFCGPSAGFTAAELEGFVDAGVDAFLAAYRGPAAV
jgi:TetR/AcrR family transcriptional repressor of mexJK operon